MRRVKDGVPNEPIREAVLKARSQGVISMGSLAYQLGYRRNAIRGDATTYVVGDCAPLKRRLGLQANRKPPYASWQTEIPYDMAVRIADCIGVDPVDLGL
jgi:hypothetical protein